MKYVKHEASDESFLRKADAFCVYTIKILKDEDVCPKSARWLGADELIKIVQRIHTELHRANNIKVTTSEEYKLRRAAQTNAYALVSTLSEKMSFNAQLYNIKTDKLTKWLTHKGKVQAWISSWIRSDDKRYGNIG